MKKILLLMFSLLFVSCSYKLYFIIDGTIVQYDAIKDREVKLLFDGKYPESELIVPDAVTINEDGSFTVEKEYLETILSIILYKAPKFTAHTAGLNRFILKGRVIIELNNYLFCKEYFRSKDQF